MLYGGGMTVEKSARPSAAASTRYPNAADLWSRALRTRPWQRVVQFAPVRAMIGLVFLIPPVVLEGLCGRGMSLGIRALIAPMLTLAFALSLVGFALVIERRRPRELSPRGGWIEWIAGFALGTTLLSATMGILVLRGAYHVEQGGQGWALLSGLFIFAPHAMFEELLMRALIFKIVEESIGSWAAMIIQAMLFGALHLGNPGATAIGATAIAIEAGLLLAAAYMYTRRLWLVWGLHLGWNWAQGSLFGVRVSGTPVSSSWLHSHVTGSDALTGGTFGVEASPVAVVLCLLAASVLLMGAVRRGQVVGWSDQRRRLRALSEAGQSTVSTLASAP